MRIQGVRRPIWVLVYAVCSLSAARGAADRESESAAKVELRCRIALPGQERNPDLWQLQLRRATGEPLRQQMVMDGETVDFKDLDPGIYVVCLKGALERQRCESVDLNVPPRGKPRRFTRSFEAPPFSALNRDAHTVTKSDLSVPHPARAELIAAEKAQLSGNSAAARQHLERALQIFPDFPDALNNLGTMYFRMGKFERATELFTHAKDIDPDCYPAWVNLSGSLTSLARFDEALTAATAALRLRPDEALANLHAGRIHFYRHEYERARTYFEKALSIDPASTESPQLFLAHIALAEHRVADAQGYYRDYLRVHPNAPDADGLRRTLRILETKSISFGETASAGH